MKTVLNKFKIFNTIAFIVFCIAIGQVLSLFLTSFLYDVNASQSMQALKDPIHADRNLVILLSLSYTLFSFFIIPVTYLLLYNKAAIRFLWTKSTIRFTPLILSVLAMVTILPFVNILIKLNSSIEFPVWLSALEGHFMTAEENARQLTGSILYTGAPSDLIIALIIMAIIPGIVEELFFRGIVQTQLQNTLNNSRYAILIGAFLFSFFHFQFYGFIPRLVMGVLLGYIFLWSKNIWYSCAAHVVNNLIGVIGGYFMGPHFLNSDTGELTSIVVLIPSVVITILVILSFRRIESRNFKDDRPAI